MNFDDGYTNPLVKAPYYREDAIAESVRWSKKTHGKNSPSDSESYYPSYWRRVWKKERHYFVHSVTKVVYERNTRYSKRAFLMPVSKDEVQHNKLQIRPGHVIDDKAPIMCQCGNDVFQVSYPASYETVGKCLECGASQTIASG